MEIETIEKTYQKKTQLEHILLRPDTYIGSVESISQSLWVVGPEDPPKFINKTIEYVPGLYKIFDEILVNAADNFQRDRKMDTIKVKIDKKNNLISVWNNGKGIPIQIHKEHQIYIPEMIFGHLLTSSNYDDSVKKVTGGRNGYGAKLTNIFSKRFSIETADGKSKKCFSMTWTKNMSVKSDHEIKNYTGEDYTCITFEPDLKRFGMKELDDDIVALMQKRVYDLAGVISNKINVYLNGKKLSVKGFDDYFDLYMSKDSEIIKISDSKSKQDRWEVIVTLSEGQFQQVSFVNSICTIKGGTHVNYIADQIVEKIMVVLKKKHKDLKIKPFQIKSYLWIFINSQIENPAFDSQTKETLTIKSSNFGSSYEITEKFIKDLLKTNILDQIVLQAKAKEQAKMAKSLTGQKKSRLLGIPKLEDANDAGTKNSEHCTLILTEGDSAKSLAMAGLEIVGRDKFGVFPLKGKLLNVREANSKQCTENQELQYLIKIMGLQFGKHYDNVKSLRYGSIMIMADQDHDGSHIKGLVINFLHHFWPSLVKMYGFIKEFVTPIIKVTKSENDVLSFFTIQDFKKWLILNPNSQKFKIKYYKGLGTSTSKEAKEYFSKIVKHQINFRYQDSADDEAIDLAFNKKKADDRKEWLQNYDPAIFVDHNIKILKFSDFINKELIQFSISDNLRSIPSICDGLKPGQRKILFSCFKRNLKSEIKIAQLAGYVAEHSAYHHGEISLSQTIIGMAQDFVGSNNINLLMPIGQFGSRNMGGKDSASARYIYTNLNKITRVLFNEADDHLYDYLEDDGDIVEPKWYLPIIPMVLVNGTEGIGTGWSTSIPCYNPVEIARNIKDKLEGIIPEFLNMQPWYRGYCGDILANEKGNNGFIINGKYNIMNDDCLEITELPISKWTRDYKSFLESKCDSPNEQENVIEDIKEFHTGNKVHFVIKLKEGKLKEIEKNDGIEKFFRLSTTVQTTNMVLFDIEGKLHRYSSVVDILNEFFPLRLEYYQHRKNFLISKIKREHEILSNKMKFVSELISDSLNLKNLKKKDIINLLIKRGYKSSQEIIKVNSKKKFEMIEEVKNEENSHEESDFNYLLNMPIWNLSYEKVESLKEELQKKQNELNYLETRSKEDFWIEDLNLFLNYYENSKDNEQKENITQKKSIINAFINNRKPPKKIKKKECSSIDEEEPESIDEDSEFEAKSGAKIEKNVKKLPIRTVKKIEKNILEEEINEKANNIIEVEEDIKINQGIKRIVQRDQNIKEKKESKILKTEPKKNIINKENKNELNKEKIDENKINSEIKFEKEKVVKNIIEEKKETNKFSLDNSILKYLKPKTNLISTKTETLIPVSNTSLLSLEERIRLRESQGNLKVFEQAYKEMKESPIKNIEISKKRERENSDELLDEFINESNKKIHLNEPEIEKMRTKREISKNRKLIIESDEEIL